jgi:hypothetical protein
MGTDYDEDFYAWAGEQAKLLAEGRFAEADLEHIIEEIECLGRSEKRELRARTRQLLVELLKWDCQPGYRCGSWRAAILGLRDHIQDVLRDSPSLRPALPAVIADEWPLVVDRTIRETGIYREYMPTECPWTTEQVLDQDFWPEEGRRSVP